MRREDIEDEKELKKFVKSCEALVRRSPEYTLWTNYLREVLGQYTCAITGEQHSQSMNDIHHHPISLYMITKLVVIDFIQKQESFCSLDVATAVLQLHFENKIGYISLAKTLHTKFHNGFLQIPIELIEGDWRYLLENYSFDDVDHDIVQARVNINRHNCGWTDGYIWSKDNYPVGVETLQRAEEGQA